MDSMTLCKKYGAARKVAAQCLRDLRLATCAKPAVPAICKRLEDARIQAVAVRDEAGELYFCQLMRERLHRTAKLKKAMLAADIVVETER